MNPDYLKSLPDQELIQNIKDGNTVNECLQELTGRHSGAYLNVIKKYSPSLPSLSKDLYGEKDYFIWKTSLSFDPSKSTKFCTYLTNMTRFHCLNMANHRANKEFCVDAQEGFKFFETEEENIEKKVDKNYVRRIISKLIDSIEDERSKEILKLRYANNKNASWRSIGRKIGLSHEMCRKIHDKEISKLKEKIVL